MDLFIFLLKFLTKRSELYNKVSEVCNLDEKSSLFIVNEAFIFDFVNEADLTEINAEIDIINHWNSQLYGKVEKILTVFILFIYFNLKFLKGYN